MTIVEEAIQREIDGIEREDIKAFTVKSIEKLRNGERDLFV